MCYSIRGGLPSAFAFLPSCHSEMHRTSRFNLKSDRLYIKTIESNSIDTLQQTSTLFLFLDGSSFCDVRLIECLRASVPCTSQLQRHSITPQ